ncbi:hypothetical protein HNP36_002362 [Chryseobacterium shigense]|uniref:Thrombospondin type 3 repeat-containing protein n=1 Tax=Chryseobacterium shigense TaxID=297244 RepID=A0A841N2C2_9FLAO|nr:hypothetical protein [Chryseobacterium shigense]
MKIKVSAVLFFVISCFHAQEITDKDAFKKCGKENSKKICLSDKDADGTLFYLDQCPETAGSAENNGCPWPDKDGDGVRDKDDLCPDLIGEIENNGCPWYDYDGDGVLDKDDACPADFGYASDDPYKNGCMKEDCKKLYEEAQIILKKFQEESKFADYDKLQDKIINDINLKLLKEDNVVIFFKNQMVTCGTTTGKNYYCPSYYDRETPVYSTEDFWNDKAVTKIYDALPKNIIFGINREGEGSGLQYEKDLILNEVSKPVKILDKNKIEKEAVLYPKLKNSQIKINKYNSLFIKILKNDFENKIKVMVLYTNADNKYGEKYIIIYQYVNNQWTTIETKKEN